MPSCEFVQFVLDALTPCKTFTKYQLCMPSITRAFPHAYLAFVYLGFNFEILEIHINLQKQRSQVLFIGVPEVVIC